MLGELLLELWLSGETLITGAWKVLLIMHFAVKVACLSIGLMASVVIANELLGCVKKIYICKKRWFVFRGIWVKAKPCFLFFSFRALCIILSQCSQRSSTPRPKEDPQTQRYHSTVRGWWRVWSFCFSWLNVLSWSRCVESSVGIHTWLAYTAGCWLFH